RAPRVALPRADRRREAGCIDEEARHDPPLGRARRARRRRDRPHRPGRRRRGARPPARGNARGRRRPALVPYDALMPRRLPGLVRGLTGGSLASVAFGEVGSSIYFALGIIALFALGLTPWVLLAVGSLFMIVSLSYAEGTAAIPETGGAAMLARRAFNDPVGFLTG